jgi:hypothetical protein
MVAKVGQVIGVSALCVKNGTHRCGNTHYQCKDCGTYRVLMLKQVYSETEHKTVLPATPDDGLKLDEIWSVVRKKGLNGKHYSSG